MSERTIELGLRQYRYDSLLSESLTFTLNQATEPALTLAEKQTCVAEDSVQNLPSVRVNDVVSIP